MGRTPTPALAVVLALCVHCAAQSEPACKNIGTLVECATREDCVYTGKLGPCMRDTFNCTCPEALYGQAGWTCSCRVVEALDKAVLAAEAVSCDGALFVQGSKHTGVCPDNADVRCSTLSNSTEGVWHVQGGVLRGNWLEGDWWSLPLRTSSYSTQLDAVLPDEFVKVCAFDRLYTLGPDVLAHLRNQPFADANLLTKARVGVLATARLYEYRILIPAPSRRRRLLSHTLSSSSAVVFDNTNLPTVGGDAHATEVLRGVAALSAITTDGLAVCGSHTSDQACNGEAAFDCHWNSPHPQAVDQVSNTCWVDTRNCVCPNTSPALYECTCALRWQPKLPPP